MISFIHLTDITTKDHSDKTENEECGDNQQNVGKFLCHNVKIGWIGEGLRTLYPNDS